MLRKWFQNVIVFENYIKAVVDEEMSEMCMCVCVCVCVEKWWNDNEKRKTKVVEEDPSLTLRSPQQNSDILVST